MCETTSHNNAVALSLIATKNILTEDLSQRGWFRDLLSSVSAMHWQYRRTSPRRRTCSQAVPVPIPTSADGCTSLTRLETSKSAATRHSDYAKRLVIPLGVMDLLPLLPSPQ